MSAASDVTANAVDTNEIASKKTASLDNMLDTFFIFKSLVFCGCHTLVEKFPRISFD
jgi:hypothetical protein